MTAHAEALQTAQIAAEAADQKQAEDIKIIDVSDRLAITDCFVIASADNERKVNAIVDNIEEKLLVAGIKARRREGNKEGRWVLLDYVDVIVHVQHVDEREFYGLDSLWKDCPTISLNPGASAEGKQEGESDA